VVQIQISVVRFNRDAKNATLKPATEGLKGFLFCFERLYAGIDFPGAGGQLKEEDLTS
jgi:hypothetical protein